jgi:hypothetical protein
MIMRKIGPIIAMSLISATAAAELPLQVYDPVPVVMAACSSSKEGKTFAYQHMAGRLIDLTPQRTALAKLYDGLEKSEFESPEQKAMQQALVDLPPYLDLEGYASAAYNDDKLAKALDDQRVTIFHCHCGDREPAPRIINYIPGQKEIEDVKRKVLDQMPTAENIKAMVQVTELYGRTHGERNIDFYIVGEGRVRFELKNPMSRELREIHAGFIITGEDTVVVEETGLEIYSASGIGPVIRRMSYEALAEQMMKDYAGASGYFYELSPEPDPSATNYLRFINRYSSTYLDLQR